MFVSPLSLQASCEWRLCLVIFLSWSAQAEFQTHTVLHTVLLIDAEPGAATSGHSADALQSEALPGLLDGRIFLSSPM